MTSEYEFKIGTAYGPVAAGDHARATQHHVAIGAGGGGDELLAGLAELRRLVEEHAAEIPEVDRVRRDVDAAERDTRAGDPDPQGLRDTIRRIIGRVGMAGTVLAAANDVQDLVDAALGG